MNPRRIIEKISMMEQTEQNIYEFCFELLEEQKESDAKLAESAGNTLLAAQIRSN